MKWEYMTVLADASGGFLGGKFKAQPLTDRLNDLGTEGWELVSAFDTNMLHGQSRDVVLIFKRPLPSEQRPAL
jgi:hypothetical protein